MKALVFAAGRGERMRPLTDATPKPLLEVGGKPLIAWHLEKLAALGVHDVVVNTSWLAPAFEPALGDGRRFGLRLQLCHEGPQPLETGGGMLNVLPLLGPDPFLVVNGDIWTDFDFRDLPLEPSGDAHLVLVDNPAHNATGDFSLDEGGRVHEGAGPRLTYAGIGLYRPGILQDWQTLASPLGQPPRFPLVPMLRAAMARGAVTGQHHAGEWTDVGTPERLDALRARLG